MPLRGRNSQGSVTLALRKEQGVWMGAVFLIWKGKKNQREHFLGGVGEVQEGGRTTNWKSWAFSLSYPVNSMSETTALGLKTRSWLNSGR